MSIQWQICCERWGHYEVKSFNDKRKITGVQFMIGVIAVSYVLTTVIFRYVDTISFTAWSVSFWDCLFEGKLNEFYSYTVLNIRGAAHGRVGGSWLTFFPWILWNFPIYLTHSSNMSLHVDSMACILWAKLFLLLCVLGIAFYAYKIVFLITKGNIHSAFTAAILAAGGGELINCVGYTGQDEVVYLLCLMIALYYMLKGRRYIFLLWGTIAVTICPIIILPFISIVLYYEKNVLKDIFFIGTTCIPSVVFEIIYRNDEIYQAAKQINTVDVFNQMMNGELFSTTVGTVSVAGTALVILLLCTYAGTGKHR